VKLRLFIAVVSATVILSAEAAQLCAEEREVPVTLRGSIGSMKRQNGLARAAGLEFVDTRAEQRRLAAAGALVPLPGNADYGLRSGARPLVARRETRAMVERVASGYRAACGEKLIVTSATRAASNQPSNSHPLSVHPAGVALDLRVSRSARCRRALEEILLGMEADGLLDVTREYYPPHYHVAVFVDRYVAFEARIRAAGVIARAADRRSSPRHDPFAVPRIAGGSRATVAAAAPAAGSAPEWAALAGLPLLAAAAAAARRRRRARG
jgi:hypothetical protein